MTWSLRAAKAALNTRLWALHTLTMEVTLGIVWVRIVQGLGEFAYRNVRTPEGHVLAVYFQCVEPAWIVLGYVNQPFVFPGRMIPDQDQAGFARRFEISAEPSNLFLRAQPTVLVKYSSWKGIDLETFECTCKSIASCKTVTLFRVFPAAQFALPTKAGIHPFMLSHSTTST